MTEEFKARDYVICQGEDSFFAGRIITPVVKFGPNLLDAETKQIRYLVQNLDGNILVKHAKQMTKSTRGDILNIVLERAEAAIGGP